MKPIPSEQYPLLPRRPRHSVTSTEKIKRVFGVEMPHWEDQLRAFLTGPALAPDRDWKPSHESE